jgi:photosystem II stability/assembly factor-like uncharacterized protein
MKLWLLFVLALPIPAAEQSLFACVISTKEYVVGSKLSPSGLFHKSPTGEWEHLAYNHPIVSTLDYDASDPSVVYLAAGNALIRAADHGRNWKFLTGSDVTELRDVVVDRNNPGTIYFAWCHGIRVSHDHGAHWLELSGGLHRKYTEAIRIDRQHSNVLVIGGEEGIFRSEDSGQTWRIAGAAGFQVLRIRQSPFEPCDWLATTQKGGMFRSSDCARTFENVGSIGMNRMLYDVAYDPFDSKRMAVAGWGPGVVISEDGGKTWMPRNTGLPRPEAVSLVFDPVHAGRLYASVNEDGLFVSKDAGKTWQKDGLEGSLISCLRFVPEASGQ